MLASAFRSTPRRWSVALVLFAAVISPAAWAESIQIHGSTTVKASLVGPNQKDIETKSGQTLDIVANGSGKGLVDLVGGKADIAMISAPLAEVVEKANKKTPNSLSADGLQAVEVGKARVAFVLHPEVKVESLTLEQLKGILTGKTTNWKDVGGPDLAIAVIAAPSGDGVRTVAEEKVLHSDPLTKDARTVNTAALVVSAVAQVPGAIGITSSAAANDKVKIVKTDKDVTATLFLVTKGQPSASAQKVIDAVKEIGAK